MQDYKGTTKVLRRNSSRGIKAEPKRKKNPTIIENRFLQIFQPCSLGNYNSLDCHL